MAYDIHPLSFGEVLDGGFRVLRDNIVLLAGIAAVVFMPWGVLQALGQTSSHVFNSVATIFILLAAPVLQAALTVAIANVYLGKPVTIEGSYRGALAILVPLLGTYLVLYLLLIGAFLLLIIPGFYLMNCWVFAGPVMIIEQRFGMESMRRSRALVRGAWWATFGMMLAAGFISEVPTLALAAVWSFIPFFGPILGAATRSVTSTYAAVVLVIYYFDRRCRVEDFDLRFLAEQVRAASGTAPLGSAGASTIA
ncbi:MAG TPA: hypothetical protein VMV27_13105 [Candidatus Binataceae bacterium]|nr:hypothetical protein [Candidatus Binataceae bacterium]